ncbi:MAG TPA: dolichyl-phosphate beta-glucosyltransferase [Pyrinomonadaceae bacterium]|jgi:glycosyltransferase involved in cell wall biosynthesis|nr:dolichyl-phosphate beta-glucosyltransferase [Pyrinomonadaceae bacterium]
MPPSHSIIIPAYNEAARISKTLPVIFDYVDREIPGSEVIVVDDGSTDETVAVALKCFERAGRFETSLVRVEPNRGKGNAVREGLLAARAPIALYSDADFSTPITEIQRLVNPILQDGCDLTFGSRAIDRSLIGVHQTRRREMGGRVFNRIVRLATGLPFWDTQCGFKAFRLSTCRPIIEAALIDGFGFDVEILFVARMAGLRLKEVAVRWDHYAGVLDGSGQYAQDSLRMIGEVRRIRRQARSGVYNNAIKAARLVASHEREQRDANSGQDRLTETDSQPNLAGATR